VLGSFDQLNSLFTDVADSFKPSHDAQQFTDRAGGVFSFKDFDATNFEEPAKPDSPPKRPEAAWKEPQVSLKRYLLGSHMPPHEEAPRSKLLKRETCLMSTPQLKERPRLFTSERRSGVVKPQTPKFTTESVPSSSVAAKPVDTIDGELYGEEIKRLEALRVQVDKLYSGPNNAELISKCTLARGQYLAAELKIAQSQARVVGLTNRLLALTSPELELTLAELLDN
jgi:hypothetical protein